MRSHRAVLRRHGPQGRGGLAAGGIPADPRQWDGLLTGQVSWLVDLSGPSTFPRRLASVVAGRTLPTHSCATAPDFHPQEASALRHDFAGPPLGTGFPRRVSYSVVRFSCRWDDYARSETPASSNVAISLSSATAARTMGRARAAPVPSPSRRSRSSSGWRPSCSSTARWPSSCER
jgi:hypothetical protein